MKGITSLFVRLLTHNIRYAANPTSTGEQPWNVRKPLMVNELQFNTLYSPEAFICLQEVLNNQLTDIMSGLNAGSPSDAPEWAYVGVGREDGKTAGEYSPIIYRPAAWKLEDFKTVWLSPTPDRPSKGWDAGSIRILTVGVFKHQQTNASIIAANTHLDNAGSKSREESAKIIVSTLGNYTSTSPPRPVFLTGDLNSFPSDTAFKILNGTDSPLKDAKDLAPFKYGDRGTFTGFDGKSKDEIDHVFIGKVSGNGRIRAYAVLENKFEDGVYNSDHRAVVADWQVDLAAANAEKGLAEDYVHQEPV